VFIIVHNGFGSVSISDFVQDSLQDEDAAHLHPRMQVVGNQTSQGICTAYRGRARGAERASTRVYEYVMTLSLSNYHSVSVLLRY
jgi:hypothetical protein